MLTRLSEKIFEKIPVRNYARRESGGRLTPSELTKNRGLIGVYAEISFFGNFI